MSYIFSIIWCLFLLRVTPKSALGVFISILITVIPVIIIIMQLELNYRYRSSLTIEPAEIVKVNSYKSKIGMVYEPIVRIPSGEELITEWSKSCEDKSCNCKRDESCANQLIGTKISVESSNLTPGRARRLGQTADFIVEYLLHFAPLFVSFVILSIKFFRLLRSPS